MSETAPVTTPNIVKASLKVGLEIHVELCTRTKMWTAAPNVAHPDFFDAEPNTLLSPVVIGMPGTLPVMNKAALEMSMKVGLALNCSIARKTKWDRKSYYYPDLPKNYQISQYDQPLCYEGEMDLPNGKTIRITRAHLEEDAGKLMHEAPGGGPIDYSIVDLNRAGTPLLEIVTEPDFESADDVVTFCQQLRDVCRHLRVTEGIMQKGQIRFEPNINVIIEADDGEVYKTPVVEIKNLNSFKAVHGSINHEYHRQIEEWKKTGQVMGARAKSTRGWDDAKEVTTMQREKEDADEYRYFPDPDLVDVIVDEPWLDRIKSEMPELLPAKRARFSDELGLDEKTIENLLDEPRVTAVFEDVLQAGVAAKDAAKYLLNYGSKHANERGVSLSELGITPAQIAGIDALLKDNKLNSSAADTLFGLCCDTDDAPDAVAEANNLLQVSDTGALEGFIDEVLNDPKNAKIVDDIKGGKDKAIGALLGQIMKLTKGSANPGVVREMILGKLNG